MKSYRSGLCSAILAMTLCSSMAMAADAPNDEWQFSLAPLFLWGISIDGSSTVGPVSAPLELDFVDDVFENLSTVVTVHFEAHKNDLALFAEFQYVDLEPTAQIPGGPKVDVSFENYLLEVGAGYRVATWGNTDVEPIVGVRWTSQELETSTFLGTTPVGADEDWFDGFAGVRFWTHFAETLTLVSRGDIGAGGSDFVWNVSFILDYRFKEWGSVFVGYRWLDYDFETGSGPDRYGYNATQQGPLAGLNFHW